jgi:tetratricopeptide (TPR) repeat protein
MLAGCDLDSVLEVEDPFTVTPAVARDTANLANLHAGARGRLLRAYAGLQNDRGGIIHHSGLLSDEMYASDNFNTRQEIDQRSVNPTASESNTSFADLQRARAEANAAAELFAGTGRAGTAQHAELHSVAGYALVMLAENFCSGVPISVIPQSGPIQFGAPETTNQILDRAIGSFDQALTLAPNDVQRNLAHLGRARALLNKGEFAAAAQAAAQVPNGFRFNVDYNASVQASQNAVFQMVNQEKRFGVSPIEGTINMGLNYRTGGEGRTPMDSVGASALGAAVPSWVQLKYPSLGAAIPLATDYEARYIQAEAALQANDITAFNNLINTARALQSLAPLTAAQLGATQAARVDVLFRERAFAMWLTAHRLGDMRRLIRQYGRNQAQVFPTGVTRFGVPYGTDVNLPIPFNEINNPNAGGGCLNRDA